MGPLPSELRQTIRTYSLISFVGYIILMFGFYGLKNAHAHKTTTTYTAYTECSTTENGQQVPCSDEMRASLHLPPKPSSGPDSGEGVSGLLIFVGLCIMIPAGLAAGGARTQLRNLEIEMLDKAYVAQSATQDTQPAGEIGYCRNCGAPITSGDTFCRKCGHPVD